MQKIIQRKLDVYQLTSSIACRRDMEYYFDVNNCWQEIMDISHLSTDIIQDFVTLDSCNYFKEKLTYFSTINPNCTEWITDYSQLIFNSSSCRDMKTACDEHTEKIDNFVNDVFSSTLLHYFIF